RYGRFALEGLVRITSLLRGAPPTRALARRSAWGAKAGASLHSGDRSRVDGLAGAADGLEVQRRSRDFHHHEMKVGIEPARHDEGGAADVGGAKGSGAS